MCLQPYSIPNPNYNSKSPLAFLKDTTSQMINVPCGHCPECLHRKQMDIVQRVLMESLNNELFFCTLTYQNKFLKDVTTSTGYSFQYADCRDLQLMFKRIRKLPNVLPFKYFAVIENGGKKLRPHFHFLLSVPKSYLPTYNDCKNYEQFLWHLFLDNWKTNVSNSTKCPIYEPNLIYKTLWKHGILYRNYDLSFVDSYYHKEGLSNVAFYTIKYMLKPNPKIQRRQQALRLNLDEVEYTNVWNLIKPKKMVSHGFGWLDENGKVYPSIVEHLRKGIFTTPGDSLFPMFFSPYNGFSSPLCDYYKSKGNVFTMKDAVEFAMRQDSVSEKDLRRKSLDSFIQFDNLVKSVDSHETDIICDFFD